MLPPIINKKLKYVYMCYIYNKKNTQCFLPPLPPLPLVPDAVNVSAKQIHAVPRADLFPIRVGVETLCSRFRNLIALSVQTRKSGWRITTMALYIVLVHRAYIRVSRAYIRVSRANPLHTFL
jgi:hypothetical protein